jgi:hypothetical protein
MKQQTTGATTDEAAEATGAITLEAAEATGLTMGATTLEAAEATGLTTGAITLEAAEATGLMTEAIMPPAAVVEADAVLAAAVVLAVVVAAAAVVELQIPLKTTPKGQSITDATTETTGEMMATLVAVVEVGTATVLEFVVAALVVTTAAAVLAEEEAAGAGLQAPKSPMPKTHLLSRAAPDRSMAAALAVAKRARTGKREYIVNEVGRVGRLT